MRTVIGLIQDEGEARRSIDDLKRMGAKGRDISVVSREPKGPYGDLELTPVDVPGLGRVSACGPLQTYLTEEIPPGSPEGVISALVDMGVPAAEARRYVDGVRSGYTLEAVIVQDDKAQEALEIIRAHASPAGLRGTQPVGDVGAGIQGGGEAVLPIIAEELRVGKREVGTGGVRVETRVQEIPVEEKVALREEQVGVERRPADRPLAEGEKAFRDQTIEVTATAEEPVVEKRARVVEEVVVRKDADVRTETVRDTVRKTDVNVEQMGPFDVSKYQQHFQGTYGTQKGATLEQYSPAYRFGHQMRGDKRFASDQWTNVEPGARTEWESKNPGTWERVKEAVRHAWERAKGG